MSGQQISIDDALDAFRKKAADLADANILLEARATGLERDLAAARKEIEQLKGTPDPTPAGPDLAAVPPYPNGKQN
ncbi:hypothetical protein [Streptomyces sp. NPDC088736]|uniref:hypothetical protein n=1 Tax=Streptomyces sp. NPDC088736 TaxID=3365881 RepID=UPI0037F3CAFD